jgi:progressive ankylosis protein
MSRVKAPETTAAPISQGEILRFFSPLAATWLMMAAEGPFLAALIARLPDPVHNLAAYGVAIAIGFVVESPIIMILSASTALVRDRTSYRRLRRFSTAMNLGVTLLVAAVALPPVFRALALDLLALPPEVAALAHRAVIMLLPWPGAIGLRRFYHGVLISSGRTRLVAYGTVVRLATMSITGVSLFFALALPGAVIATTSLSAGVVAEAIAARLWARGDVKRLLATAPDDGARPLSYKEIGGFYLPLLLTPLINMAAQPMITFFLGRGALPLESLAVMPVLNSFGFLFRCTALAFQETVIALSRRGEQALAALRRFAIVLGGSTTAAMAIVALTPLGGLWFEDVSNLTPTLLALAIPAVLVLVPTPALSTAVCFLHARLVATRRTRVITAGTVIEVATVAAVLAGGIALTRLPAVFVAVAAILSGRLAATVFLVAFRRRSTESAA